MHYIFVLFTARRHFWHQWATESSILWRFSFVNNITSSALRIEIYIYIYICMRYSYDWWLYSHLNNYEDCFPKSWIFLPELHNSHLEKEENWNFVKTHSTIWMQHNLLLLFFLLYKFKQCTVVYLASKSGTLSWTFLWIHIDSMICPIYVIFIAIFGISAPKNHCM